MLVICEECSKKYNVDETMMRGERARFSCYECGHVIVVDRRTPAKAREIGASGRGNEAPLTPAGIVPGCGPESGRPWTIGPPLGWSSPRLFLARSGPCDC